MSKVLTAPNAVLRQVTKPITGVDKKLLSLISDMIITLRSARDPEGVGLAAPQIGVSLRLFVIQPTPKSQPEIFINPEILKFSQRLQKGDSKAGVYEGCLSIPHHYSPLSRSMSVTVKYQMISEAKLIEKTATFTGLTAHIIQHETDHLNGILFVDRVLEQNAKLFNIRGKKWEELSL